MTKAGLLASAATFVALAAFPALAQETNTTANTTVQAGQQVTLEQDAQFAMAAATSDLKEMRAGEVAVQRAQNPEVKNFAQMMIDEHTKSTQKLQPIAQAKQIELPVELDGDNEDFIENLNGWEGAEFDAEYMAQMVKDHEAAVLLMEQEISLGQDAELKAFASETLPAIQKHLEMARGLATQVAQVQQQTEQTQAAADTDATATQQGATATTTTTAAGSATADLGALTAEELIGDRVVNANGEDVGEIEDIVLNKDRAAFALVDVGGFLGIGEKRVAVPFDRLQLQQDGQATLMSNVSQDELNQLPAWDQGTDWASAPRTERILQDTAATAGATAEGVANTAATTAEDVATTTQDVAASLDPATQPVTGATALGAMTADELIGDRVANANGEDIGEINDIVLGQDKAVFAILDVGGFLGIGEKQVAVPFDRLQLNQDGQTILMSNVSEEELQGLPAWQQSDDWTAAPRDQALLNAEGTDATVAEQTAETTATTQTTADAGATTPAGLNPALGQRTASDLIGQRVVNADGRDLGEIGDLVMSNDNQALFAIIDVGGFLGMGEKAVAVPFDRLALQDDQAVLRATVTEDELKSLPDFDQAGYAAFPRDVRIADQYSGVARQNVATETTTTAEVDPAAGTQVASTADAATNRLGEMTAEQVIGQNVRNANGEDIGEIEDIILNKDQAVFALVDVGGFLGMGERRVAVPFDRLRMGDDEAILMSDVTADELKGLPAWEEGAPDWTQYPRGERLVRQQ